MARYYQDWRDNFGNAYAGFEKIKKKETTEASLAENLLVKVKHDNDTGTSKGKEKRVCISVMILGIKEGIVRYRIRGKVQL